MACSLRTLILGTSLALAVAAHAQSAAQSVEPAAPLTPAQAAYARFKSLEGEWTAKSTKGWTADTRYKVIANGSTVLSTSLDAHPNETMLTLIHMDGDRLMLTHYCVAGNQPRLVATDFADDGATITFTFLDGTNLPSRDRGHMDRVVYRFGDGDNFSSRWTWYQNGSETWLEEIVSTRNADASS